MLVVSVTLVTRHSWQHRIDAQLLSHRPIVHRKSGPETALAMTLWRTHTHKTQGM